jgi:pSer/pThr/pTyr-binding forkhead associated (FHA) protein
MQLEPAQASPSAGPAVTPTPPAAPSEPSKAYITGRLEIKTSGASITIPPGKTEVIIGREDPVSGIFPEIDLDPHGGHDGGVGRKHARLFLQDSQLMIDDQDSVNGTLLNKQRLAPYQPYPVRDGDELRFGKIVVIYHAS